MLSYEEAVRFLLSREKIDPKRRNVILSHQFYTAGQSEPETCDSEAAVAMAGGLDRSIDIRIAYWTPLTMAALGHLHGSQRVGRESARYCGTPYKYSVSEERHHKAVTVVELGKKGEEPRLRLPASFRPAGCEKAARYAGGGCWKRLPAVSRPCRPLPPASAHDLSASPSRTSRSPTGSESGWRSAMIICWSFASITPGPERDWRERDQKTIRPRSPWKPSGSFMNRKSYAAAGRGRADHERADPGNSGERDGGERCETVTDHHVRLRLLCGRGDGGL